jgi:transcriptional regulator with XRE-family HTH domain
MSPCGREIRWHTASEGKPRGLGPAHSKPASISRHWSASVADRQTCIPIFGYTVACVDSKGRLRKRLAALIEAAGFNRSQAAHAVGCTPSRLGDYLAGRTVPSALVLLDLEVAAEQAAHRSWMRASDVIDAVATHCDSDPVWAMRMLLQGRDQSIALSTPARRAIWATGSPRLALTGPWKTLAYTILRETARDGRPIPQWLAAPMPLREPWAPLPLRRGRPVDEGLAMVGIEINDRELVTA